MAASTTPIPLKAAIVDPKTGAINLFFRQIWEQLRTALITVPTLGIGVTLSGQAASLVSKLLYTTTTAGFYRVTYYARKMAADGVSSSLQFVWYWTENGVPLSETDAALTTDTTVANKSGSKVFYCDANVGITFDETYASNTPGQMTYNVWVRIELLN